MRQAHPPEPINWKQLITTEEPPTLEGSVQEQGVKFHQWLKECFETSTVPFERDLDWATPSDEQGGRFDCFDGHYIYEFKTVSELPEAPRPDDVEQLQRYLQTLDADHGLLVYVVRRSLTVRQHLIEK